MIKLGGIGRMAELVDAPDSKSSSSNGVWVRFPLRPPFWSKNPNPRPTGRFFGSNVVISATGKKHFCYIDDSYCLTKSDC